MAELAILHSRHARFEGSAMRRSRIIITVLAFALSAGVGRADSVRFRFVPPPADGPMAQMAIGPDGSLGELRTGLRGTPKPFAGNFQPNRLVTFRHPYTSRDAIVPMKLPENTPRTERIGDRIRFNYGSYYVEARFLPDGAVDVIYNSGLLRTLP
jgi:hypothetical protein